MKGNAAKPGSRENVDVERTGYTRVYATLSGAFLVLLGLFGLLENAEFEIPELGSDLFGIYAVNGWANLFHVAIGLLALIMARRLSRVYALIATLVFLGLAIWGISAPDGDLLFSKLPAERPVNLLNLLLGLAALACLVAGLWDRLTGLVAARLENRKARTSRREGRRRRRRQEELASRQARGGSSSKTGS